MASGREDELIRAQIGFKLSAGRPGREIGTAIYRGRVRELGQGGEPRVSWKISACSTLVEELTEVVLSRVDVGRVHDTRKARMVRSWTERGGGSCTPATRGVAVKSKRRAHPPELNSFWLAWADKQASTRAITRRTESPLLACGVFAPVLYSPKASHRCQAGSARTSLCEPRGRTGRGRAGRRCKGSCSTELVPPTREPI